MAEAGGHMPPEEEWEDEEEDEEDDDDDAEAEEIARRLGDQLWADINKAQADRAGAAAPASAPQPPPAEYVLPAVAPPSSPTRSLKKREDAILSMKGVLACVEKDTLARSVLASTVVPGLDGDSVLDVLGRTVASGTVTPSLAMHLRDVVLFLARSDSLFSALRHSNTSSIHLDKGKRKRENDEGPYEVDDRGYKRPYQPQSDLQIAVTQAVRIIAQALSANSSNQYSLEPAVIASIQLQLHQVFLFAVTSSAGGGADMSPLQEISGLIQVLGVLSGIQIGPTPGSQPPEHPSAGQRPPLPFPPNIAQSQPWMPPQPDGAGPAQLTDIGTAVYPCLVPGCRKTFSRLYSLRAHQRIHAVHRPFRCAVCPASFARNHDLKRHAKLHERKAWKCGGCGKSFSRRDAIKRHKNSNKTRGGKGDACVDAEVREVDLDAGGEELVKEERRAKMWNGFGAPGAPAYRAPEDAGLEDGEVPPAVIAHVQAAVMSLQGLLQAHVATALGAPAGQAVPADPSGGQATLASVIARAQLQNLPLKVPDQVHAVPPAPLALPPDPAGAGEVDDPQGADGPGGGHEDGAQPTTLAMYGLSDEQTKMLEQAIANAASAAQAQAEAEAALEEEEDDSEDEDDHSDHVDVDPDAD